MEDAQIIELFFARSEDAISELDKKYGKLCHKLADNILASAQDAEECVNDAYAPGTRSRRSVRNRFRRLSARSSAAVRSRAIVPTRQ